MSAVRVLGAVPVLDRFAQSPAYGVLTALLMVVWLVVLLRRRR